MELISVSSSRNISSWWEVARDKAGNIIKAKQPMRRFADQNYAFHSKIAYLCILNSCYGKPPTSDTIM